MLNKLLRVSWMILCGLALLPLVIPAEEPPESVNVPLDDQPAELVRHVVWKADEPLEPDFLPAAVLQSPGGRSSTFGRDALEGLDHALEDRLRRKQEGEPASCSWSSESSFAEHESPRGRSMLDLLRLQPMTALGRVVAVVPGWALDQAMTMVYVETEELLHCKPGYGVDYPVRDIRVGDVISTTLRMGSFELEGATLCTRFPDKFVLPEVGDRVVIAGAPSPGDPYFIRHWGPVFVVEGGQVLPQPLVDFQWDRVSLSDLREAFGAPHLTCERAR